MEIKYRFYNTDYLPPILEYGDTSDLKFVERSIGKKKQLSILLKDKNGKDIYEGDIVESDGSMNFSNYDSDKGSKREIYFMGSGFTGVRVNNEFDKSHFSSAHNWDNYTLYNIRGSITVIGNIYEDPKLL